jgi:beta-lactamase class A
MSKKADRRISLTTEICRNGSACNGKILLMKQSRYSPQRKRSHSLRWLPAVFGGLFLLLALIIAVVDYVHFQQPQSVYPDGVSVEGIPLGGLDRSQAEVRLAEAFSVPVELRYRQARLQFSPAELGFKPDYSATLSQIDEHIPKRSWVKHLWGKTEVSSPSDNPLIAEIDLNQIKATLEQVISQRYDQPATATLPIIYSTNYQPGQAGYALRSLTATAEDIQAALLSPDQRIVTLDVQEIPALPLDRANLEIFLKQTIQLEKFNGLIEIYQRDFTSGEVMHIALRENQAVTPDVAYSAASTIKIPIMVSVMRRLEEPLPSQASNWMFQMIAESLNPPADGLMKAYLDNDSGPLMVTADLRELGYQNTFLAGYFEPGSPLLERITTPANQRRDIFLDPDFYNQTVPSETGDLLWKIYRCANQNELIFDGQVTASECQQMLNFLLENRIHALIEAGLPPEGRAAHKHGWTNDLDGLIHTISDSAVVYTPGGDYVLVIFAYTEEQFLFDTANQLFAKLSQSIYNAYNPEHQAAWYGEN